MCLFLSLLYTVPVLCALPGAYCVLRTRDGEELSLNPMCTSKNETPAFRPFYFRWSVIAPLLTAEKGGNPRSDFSLSHSKHQRFLPRFRFILQRNLRRLPKHPCQ